MADGKRLILPISARIAGNLAEHLSGPLGQVKGMAVCSPDTLLRGIKELSCASTELINPNSGVTHQCNINAPLNKLMVKSLRGTGQLKTGNKYDLDYDNQVIFTEKWDAGRTYRSCYGYQPAIASINNMPVYIEGRGGNSQAKYAQEDTLARGFRHLSDHQISIGRFRADSASYQKDVVRVVEGHCNSFYIRAVRSAGMDQQIGALSGDDWKQVRMGTQKMDVAELGGYRPFGGKTACRLVVSRITRNDCQADLFSGLAYTWRAILANDMEPPLKISSPFTTSVGTVSGSLI